MEQGLRVVIGYLVILVEACGALVVVAGVARSIVEYVRTFLSHDQSTLTSLRLRLGQNMVMGLEFLVAADILRTSLTPTWNEMLLLAALISLRTILNYFVERELRALGVDRSPSASGGSLSKMPVAE